MNTNCACHQTPAPIIILLVPLLSTFTVWISNNFSKDNFIFEDFIANMVTLGQFFAGRFKIKHFYFCLDSSMLLDNVICNIAYNSIYIKTKKTSNDRENLIGA